MPRIDSDKMDRALRGKMKAEIDEKADRIYYIYDDNHDVVCSTSISQGGKETLRDSRVAAMRRQLGLETTQQLVELVNCKISREEALGAVQKQLPQTWREATVSQIGRLFLHGPLETMRKTFPSNSPRRRQ